MELAAKLTTGWPGWQARGRSPHDALHLHHIATDTAADADYYSAALQEQLQNLEQPEILGVDHLFRKSTAGAKPIKKFIGALAALPSASSDFSPCLCHIDAFAYAFLKGAKNFDLLMPLAPAHNADFFQTWQGWQQIIVALQQFERFGQPLPTHCGITPDQYLSLRNVIARPSVRDELRALATLLLSGPSTMAQISEDLALNYTLGQRSLAVFENAGAITRYDGDVFAIAPSALPLVIFSLRETLGLDLLSSLPRHLLHG